MPKPNCHDSVSKTKNKKTNQSSKWDTSRSLPGDRVMISSITTCANSKWRLCHFHWCPLLPQRTPRLHTQWHRHLIGQQPLMPWISYFISPERHICLVSLLVRTTQEIKYVYDLWNASCPTGQWETVLFRHVSLLEDTVSAVLCCIQLVCESKPNIRSYLKIEQEDGCDRSKW